jgi:hypothetical protein
VLIYKVPLLHRENIFLSHCRGQRTLYGRAGLSSWRTDALAGLNVLRRELETRVQGTGASNA